MNLFSRRVSPIILALLFISSCVSRKLSDSKKLQGLADNYCAPSVPYDSAAVLPVPPVDPVLESLLKDKLSTHDQLLCHALGITPWVASLIRNSSTPDVNRIELKQKITGRLLLATFRIQALSAELDCEGERVEQVAVYLDKLNSRKNNSLIITGVILGALTTVATALITNGDAAKGVAISGGLLSAGFGALTINSSGKKIPFLHPRNLLQDIWTGSLIPGHYPSDVWYILHEKKFSTSGEVTLAQHIKDRWLQFEFNGKISKAEEALFFGSGNLYNAAGLHQRAGLINQLQSTIRSIHQDLSALMLSLDKLF